jgi:hypothetical protein
LTNSHKFSIFRLIKNSPFISINQIILQANLLFCGRTLTRYLKKHGVMHQKALLRPKLTPEVAAERFAFANEHINNDLFWWERVIFSDETTIARGEGERQGYVFCIKVGHLQAAIISLAYIA